MELREYSHLTIREHDLCRFLNEAFSDAYNSPFRRCRVTSVSAILANGHPDRGGFKIEFEPLPPKPKTDA